MQQPMQPTREDHCGMDSRPSLADLYQQHQDMCAKQRGLQEGLTSLCSELHTVTQQNISLHQQLIQTRQAYKALQEEHAAVMQQMRSACLVQVELETRVQAQQQLLALLSSGCLAGAEQAPGAVYKAGEAPQAWDGKRSVEGAGDAAQGEKHEDDDEEHGQERESESGFFGGLELIGEAIEQMESEERCQEQEALLLGRAVQPLTDGSGSAAGSDHSAGAFAPPGKHSGASTPEQMEVAEPAYVNAEDLHRQLWAGGYALPGVLQPMEHALPSPPRTGRASGRNSQPAKGRAAARRGVAKAKGSKRKRS